VTTLGGTVCDMTGEVPACDNTGDTVGAKWLGPMGVWWFGLAGHVL
jgi:hypothetical protein